MMKVPASKWWLYKHCAPDADPVRRAAASRDSFIVVVVVVVVVVTYVQIGLRRDELWEEMLVSVAAE